MNSELLIISLNSMILLIAYFWVYPKSCGSNLLLLSCLDFIFSCIALLAVASKYWGSEQQFNILVGQVNWFWFTLMTYVLIEIPLMLWYMNKNDISLK